MNKCINNHPNIIDKYSNMLWSKKQLMYWYLRTALWRVANTHHSSLNKTATIQQSYLSQKAQSKGRASPSHHYVWTQCWQSAPCNANPANFRHHNQSIVDMVGFWISSFESDQAFQIVERCVCTWLFTLAFDLEIGSTPFLLPCYKCIPICSCAELHIFLSHSHHNESKAIFSCIANLMKSDLAVLICPFVC